MQNWGSKRYLQHVVGLFVIRAYDKRRMVIRALIILSGAAMIFMTGCALPQRFGIIKERYGPFPEELTSPLPPEAMFRVLTERAPEVQNLWAEMKVKIRGKSKKESGYFQATLLYSPPAMARLRGSRTITSTLFELLVVNDRLFFHLKPEKKLYAGNVSEWQNSPLLLPNIDLRDIAYLLQPLQILRSSLQADNYHFDDIDKDFYFITIAKLPHSREFSGRLQLLVRKKDLLIQRIRVYSPEQELKVLVNYEQYAVFGNGTVLPTNVAISLYAEKSKITLRNIKYKINSQFDKRVFLPPAYKGIKVFPLKELWQKDTRLKGTQ